jgi:hypothetical protein
VNLADIRAEVKRFIEVDDPFWDDPDELNSAINEAQSDLSLRTELIMKSSTVPLFVDVGVYDVPSDAIRLLYVHLNDKRLAKVMPRQLALVNRAWAVERGTPHAWYPIGLKRFGVFPIPFRSGDTLTVLYVAQAAPLINDADVSDFYDSHKSLIAAAARSFLLYKEDKNMLALGAGIFADYAQRVSRAR